MRIRLTDKFKWSPPELNGTWTQVFQPGEHTVTTACGNAAIAAGKGSRIAAPRKKAADEKAD
ncbi:MAG TPA: hypothetical protein VMF90_12380 [Rhizobiaceae bacterium]|nr:hypothetical protein [Rhizobiaceae bacterium]